MGRSVAPPTAIVEEPALDRRCAASEHPDGARRRPERLLHGVLCVLGRAADLEPEAVDALPVGRDKLGKRVEIAGLRGSEEGVGRECVDGDPIECSSKRRVRKGEPQP
jgi:hypothetical protein